MDLDDTLKCIGEARALLTKCPEGAELALAVMAAHGHRVRDDLTYSQLRYVGAVKGAHSEKPGRSAKVEERDALIYEHALRLSETLSANSKAKIIKKKMQLSLTVDSIRKIIASGSSIVGRETKRSVQDQA